MLREQEQRRENRSRLRLRQAGFPWTRTLEELELDRCGGRITRAFLNELGSCEFIREHRNLVLIGNPGRGKTHLAIGVGLRSCAAGMSVHFATAAALCTQLREAREQLTLGRLHEKLRRVDLLILDELGYVRFDRLQRSCCCGWWPTAASAAASSSPPTRPLPPGTSSLTMRPWPPPWLTVWSTARSPSICPAPHTATSTPAHGFRQRRRRRRGSEGMTSLHCSHRHVRGSVSRWRDTPAGQTRGRVQCRLMSPPNPHGPVRMMCCMLYIYAVPSPAPPPPRCFISSPR